MLYDGKICGAMHFAFAGKDGVSGHEIPQYYRVC